MGGHRHGTRYRRRPWMDAIDTEEESGGIPLTQKARGEITIKSDIRVTRLAC